MVVGVMMALPQSDSSLDWVLSPSHSSILAS